MLIILNIHQSCNSLQLDNRTRTLSLGVCSFLVGYAPNLRKHSLIINHKLVCLPPSPHLSGSTQTRLSPRLSGSTRTTNLPACLAFPNIHNQQTRLSLPPSPVFSRAQVYGSEACTAESLRERRGGRLRTGHNHMPIKQPASAFPVCRAEDGHCIQSGDIR